MYITICRKSKSAAASGALLSLKSLHNIGYIIPSHNKQKFEILDEAPCEIVSHGLY